MDESGASARAASRAGEARSSETRAHLLDVAFAEMHEHGFQGLRIDVLLAKAQLTKGAFYHYFASKTDLGLAVIDELLAGYADLIWGQHLQQFADPLEGIEASFSFAMGLLGPRLTTLGCPMNNLAQEMSALDERFRARLDALFVGIVRHIATALEGGKERGLIRPDVDCENAATFIFAAFEGAIGLAKSAKNAKALTSAQSEMRRYFETLRADGGGGKR
ncbi:TetR/AcrR family transcriptional regulator [Rhodoblastus sp.]|uniref:TetR/AcrR family transcriptional regulator n=1 Tax=Rhodoblastus sp. TaxID=1962975 RepID=UPI002612DA66|nr:TetR/AcrR family transcriptional regulator [Rhodoblastus sp.]